MLESACAGTAVALGYFDGVHTGHRCIMNAAVQYAAQHGLQSAAFTFHFARVRTKEPDILTLSERCRRIYSLGIQRIECPEFDAIAALNPEEFVQEILQRRLNAKAVFCGENFRFGAKAAGDVACLKALCQARGIQVFPFELQYLEGEPVSATRIRALLAKGELARANALLGEPYALDLPVQHGQQLGGSLGFPTVNQIFPAWMQLPAEGVYRTQAFVEGQSVPAATGLGRRPTVNGDSVTCETFLCRWQGNAYGTCPRIVFLEYLWPVQKFETLQQLQDCIGRAAQLSCCAFDSAPLPKG